MIEALKKAFLEDHRNMTRGLTKLRRAIDENDLSEAKAVADDLDVKVGPHIEFEETVFYPELLKLLGPEYIVRLYREHRVGRRAIERVLGLENGTELDDAEQHDLIAQIDATLQHAFSCGTLLSHLNYLDDERQEELAEDLKRLRSLQHRWTELPARGKRLAS